MNELLEYAFGKLDAKNVELNVFDWNIAGIRCYEKSGFVVNPDKTSLFEIDDKQWTALNMSIDKGKWLNTSQGK